MQFETAGAPIAFTQALQWIRDDSNANGLDSYAAKLPSDALPVVDSLGHRSHCFTDEHSVLLVDANNLHNIIEKFMNTQRRDWNSSSQNWQSPWQNLVAFVSARKFWRDLRSSSFGLDSLQGLYSTSMANLVRCRAVIYLLLSPHHQCNTVPAFVKYLRALDPVLADPKAPLGGGSWFDLDASFEAAAAVQAQQTRSSGPHFDASRAAAPASSFHIYAGQQPVPSG
jgi:hypothetical protein